MVGDEFTPLKDGRVKIVNVGMTQRECRVLGHVHPNGRFVPKNGLRVPRRVREAILVDWERVYGPGAESYWAQFPFKVEEAV